MRLIVTNEMKLLRAFIEASGYEIEEARSTTWFDTGVGDPTIKEEIGIIDYKVTKKVDHQRKRNFIVSAFAEHEAGATTKSELINLFVEVL